MSKPDYVGNNESDELEALLESQNIQNSFPRTGDTSLLPSYSSEPPESAQSINLRKQVRQAIRSTWKFDPMECSVKASFRLDQDQAASPNLGFTEEEYRWILTGGKLTRVKKARNGANVDSENNKKRSEWRKNSDEGDEVFDFLVTDIDQELDDFYGTVGTDLRPINHDSDDEGFSEPHVIVKRMISLPEKSLMEEGVTPGGVFQDSGISMDEGYAEYSLAQSVPNTGKETTGTVPSDWPTFKADIAPLRVPKQKGRWLGLVGDQKQCEWPGRRQGPYDLHGLTSWVHPSTSDHEDVLDECETINSDSEDMAGSFTPQPATRETSITRHVEASADRNVEAAGAQSSAGLPAAEVRDIVQIDTAIGNITDETALPVENTSSIGLGDGTQEMSGSVQEEVNGEASKTVPQSFDQEHSSPLHDSNDNGGDIATPGHIHFTSVSDKVVGDSEASVGDAQSVSEGRPQHFPSFTGNGNDGESSVPAFRGSRGVLQVDMNAGTHTRRSITPTSFTTPVNQRTRHFHQVQAATPATPATINVILTPEYDGDMDTDDSSNESLEVRLPNSPTTNTQKGQSALGRYVQETVSRQDIARPSSTTISLAGSVSEDVSLIPTQEHPSQPEGHAGFTKGVEIHQKKSDAAFTLESPNKSQGTPSPRKTPPIPVTPAERETSASFRPITPFQLNPSAHLDFNSPGTPTPAPRPSKAHGNCIKKTSPIKTSKADAKSVANIFNSPMLGTRSPERTQPSSDIIAAPFTPTAGSLAQHHGSPFSGQGLLFHRTPGKEKRTQNVLNSLQLHPGRGRAALAPPSDDLEDYADELAAAPPPKKASKPTSNKPAPTHRGRNVAQAVLVPSKVHPRDDVHVQEPRVKKPRKSRGDDHGSF